MCTLGRMCTPMGHNAGVGCLLNYMCPELLDTCGQMPGVTPQQAVSGLTDFSGLKQLTVEADEGARGTPRPHSPDRNFHECSQVSLPSLGELGISCCFAFHLCFRDGCWLTINTPPGFLDGPYAPLSCRTRTSPPCPSFLSHEMEVRPEAFVRVVRLER